MTSFSPPFTRVFADPNRPIALAIREQFSTPHVVAPASLSGLKNAYKPERSETRRGYHLGEAKILQLQELAKQTIGTRDVDRQRSLTIEQKQLIRELHILLEHLEQLEEEITHIVATPREGQILLSIPPIGPIQAATIIATVGNIGNFERTSELKSYFGWAPKRDQTGVSFDRSRLTRKGTRPMKQMLFLMAARATRFDCEWSRLYQRLLPRLATYDERTKEYRGKLRVIGRIAGQMTSMIFAFLKTDQELLSHVAPGQEPPPPLLYDPAIHRKHQEGLYRSLKPSTSPRKIIQLPHPP